MLSFLVYETNPCYHLTNFLSESILLFFSSALNVNLPDPWIFGSQKPNLNFFESNCSATSKLQQLRLSAQLRPILHLSLWRTKHMRACPKHSRFKIKRTHQ